MKNKLDEFFGTVSTGMVKEPRTAVAVLTGVSFLLGVYCLMTILEMVRVSQDHEWLSFVLMIPIFLFMLVIMVGMIKAAMDALFQFFEEKEDDINND